MMKKAMKLAYEAHYGQTDKNGMPYIFHPMHLAEQMKDENISRGKTEMERICDQKLAGYYSTRPGKAQKSYWTSCMNRPTAESPAPI